MFMLLPSLLGGRSRGFCWCLVLSSYLLPEQSFVWVSVHCTCVLAAYDALHSPSLWRLSSIGPSGVEFYAQRALCCLLLCAHFRRVAFHDYNRMLPQSYKQFCITDWWCWIRHYSLFSALNCIMSHAMQIQTTCRTYICQADVSSAWHISLDHSGLPEQS